MTFIFCAFGKEAFGSGTYCSCLYCNSVFLKPINLNFYQGSSMCPHSALYYMLYEKSLMLCFTWVYSPATHCNKGYCIKKVLKSLSMTLIRAAYSWPSSQASWEYLIQTHFSISDRNFPFWKVTGDEKGGDGREACQKWGWYVCS